MTKAQSKTRRVGNLLPTVCSSFTDRGLIGSDMVGNKLPTLQAVSEIGVAETP